MGARKRTWEPKMEGKIKSLVHTWLAEVDPKAANLFKKNNKPKGLPTDAAGLKEIVTFYEKNFKQQKISPAKKLDEEKNVVKSPSVPPPAKITNGKAAAVPNGKPADEDEKELKDEESSDEEENGGEEEKAVEEVVKPATAPSAMDEDDDEDEEEDEDEDDDEEEEDEDEKEEKDEESSDEEENG